MDVHKMLAELYEERDHIDAAIAALDRIAESTGQRRRGRPPKWLKEARKNKETGQESRSAADKPRPRPSKRK